MAENSYKSIVKSTTVFGSAQLIQMLITILRAKFIAIILGSTGMGINAIFQSTLASFNAFSSFGIFQSAVRDISKAKELGDEKKLGETKYIFEQLTKFTGILGMLLCIIASPWLSKLAFENYDYTWSFILLSLALPLMALANGETTLLQGTRHLTHLAKGSIIGAILGLFTGIPLYYLFGMNGIVASIVLGYLFFYIIKHHYAKKINFKKVDKLSIREIVKEGKPMIKLGTVLMLGTLSITIFTYLTNVLIGRIGAIEDVGYFQGASSVVTQSIVVIIAVLASDFYPRLSAVCDNREKVYTMINQQLELVLLIITPIVVVLILFAPFIVRLLLSSDFLLIVPMLRWMSLALLFRGIWITMSYIILAKGDKKIYFYYDALLGNGLVFILNIIAYSFWGLSGLGFSFLIGSFFTSIILLILVYKRYKIVLSRKLLSVFSILCSFCILSYSFSLMLAGYLYFITSLLLITCVILYSFHIINKRINLMSAIKVKLK